MDKYKSLHLWMIIPMVLMQAGIFEDYWGDFTDNAWSVHVHYWNGTIWYLYLIIQPYFATHGQLSKHRTNGIIGMFLAGGVCLTALSMLNRDIQNASFALEHPESLGPFQPWFFYGVAAVELVMMTAFGYAVIQSILQRKEMENHAWWLISTVFIIMMPALGRGMQNLYVDLHREAWPDINIMVPIYITQAIILSMIVWGALRFGKTRHPATYLSVSVNLSIFALQPVGRSENIQHLLQSVFKA